MLSRSILTRLRLQQVKTVTPVLASTTPFFAVKKMLLPFLSGLSFYSQTCTRALLCSSNTSLKSILFISFLQLNTSHSWSRIFVNGSGSSQKGRLRLHNTERQDSIHILPRTEIRRKSGSETLNAYD